MNSFLVAIAILVLAVLKEVVALSVPVPEVVLAMVRVDGVRTLLFTMMSNSIALSFCSISLPLLSEAMGRPVLGSVVGSLPMVPVLKVMVVTPSLPLAIT